MCCNDDDVWPSEDVKRHKNMAGNDPLPLCGVCVELNVQPPLKPGRARNFVEMGRQASNAKKKKRAEVEAKSLRKPNKKGKRSKK